MAVRSAHTAEQTHSRLTRPDIQIIQESNEDGGHPRHRCILGCALVSPLNNACGRTKARVSCTLAHLKADESPDILKLSVPSQDAGCRRDQGSIAMPERTPRHLYTPLLGELVDGLQGSNAHVRICI